jgi:branched-chain amino acid transport system ATP-binding protein
VTPSASSSPATPFPALSARRLTRRFGGLVAVRDVDLELSVGELHAVIGPNGAGKSTLINLLSGDLAPTAGEIGIGGEDVAGWPAWRIARRGVGRSYQRTNILGELTVLENVRLAAQARRTVPAGLLVAARRRGDIVAAAEAALATVGLAGRAARTAGLLSHGEQRQLEIAMTLATDPTILLLDEPLAGMGPEEAERTGTLIAELARHHAVLLVEHDMDVVFAISDRVTVMVNGAVIATGAPDAVRADPQVRVAYLGEDA